MAAVNITNDAVTYSQPGARVVVRDSSGIPYVVILDEDSSDVTIWKGNGTTPTSFSEQDAGNGPSGTDITAMAAAIDSSDVIHVVYYDADGKDTLIGYATMSSDTWSVTGDISIGQLDGASSNPYCAIAIDANDIPHIAYVDQLKVGGSTRDTVFYSNNVSGWKTAVEVEGTTAGRDCFYPDIAIDADNKPCIAYFNDQDKAIGTAQGDANNASSFTLNDVTTFISASNSAPSIAIDSSGNHWVAYWHADNDIATNAFEIISHTYGNAWTSWNSIIGDGQSSGSQGQKIVSLVIDGTDKYIFYEKAGDSNIKYNKYDGSWLGETTLETGTFNSAKAKWGFWVDNDSGGSVFTKNTYYFDGSDAVASDPNSAWNNETNADDGDVDTDATSSTNGSETTNYLQIEGTNAPSSGGTIQQVTVQVHDGTDYGDDKEIILGNPSGGWTWAKVQGLEIRFAKGDVGPQLRVWVYLDGDAGGTELNEQTYAGNAGSATISRANVNVYTVSRSELDYTFADEVSGEEDIWFNSLTLAAAALEIDASDSITLTEDSTVVLSQPPLNVNENDSVTITEDSTVLINYLNIDVSDSITATDEPNTVEIFEPTRFIDVSDSVTITEDSTIRITSYVDTSEDVTVTEDSTIRPTSYIDTSDSITTTEDSTPRLTSYINANDSVTVTDAVLDLIEFPLYISVNDAITTTEDVTIQLTSYITANDSITITEDVSVLIPLIVSSSEDITITEDATVRTTLYINASDSVTVSEDTTLHLTEYISASDTITITENISVLITTLYIDVSDSVTVTEDTSIVITSYIDVSDSVTISEDTTTLINYLNVDVNDAITITEDSTVRSTLYINVSDDVSISEDSTVSIISAGAIEIDVSDNVTITEDSTIRVTSYISEGDSVTITEDTPLSLSSYITTDDSITITENVTLVRGSYVDVSESVTVTENVNVNVQLYVSTNDEILVNGINYYANALPQDSAPTWTRSGAIGTEEISPAGFLHTISDTSTNYYYLNTNNPNYLTGVTVEFRLKIIAGQVFDDFDANGVTRIFLRILNNDGSKYIQESFYIWSDAVLLDTNYPNTYSIDTTDDYHTYRITTKYDGVSAVDLNLYIDGTLADTTSPVIINMPSSGQITYEPDANGAAGIEGSLDYLTVSYDDAYAPNDSIYVDVVINELFVSASDAITVTENISLYPNSYIDQSDNITLSEYVDVLRGGARDIDVGDDLIVSESVSVNSTDNPQVDAGDEVTVTEDTTVRTTLYIDTNDTVTITEDTPISLASYIEVTDSITITESSDVDIFTYISVSDSITATEDSSVLIPTLYIDTSDNITITENESVVIPTLFVDTADTVTVSEDATVRLTSYISVSDSITITDVLPFYHLEEVTVTDGVTVEKSGGAFDVDVSDSIAITENTTVYIPTLYIDTSDSLTVSEDTPVSLRSYINTYDDITITESVSVSSTCHINESDSITVTEDVTITTETAGQTISSYEDIGVTENSTVQVYIYISVSDDITISEDTDVRPNPLLISASDSVTITESTPVSFASYISVYEDITLTEDATVTVAAAEAINVNVADELGPKRIIYKNWSKPLLKIDTEGKFYIKI